MGKYAKPRNRKSEQKGWRPTTGLPPTGIHTNDIDRMAEKVQKILSNSHIPDEAELAILKQVKLLCLRTIAFRRGDSTNEFNNQLSHHGDVLHRHGLKEDKDIIPLNLWITRKVVFQKGVEKERIVELLQQVEGKMTKANKK